MAEEPAPLAPPKPPYVRWDVISFDSPFKTWIVHDNRNGQIAQRDPALATMNHPFTGPNINQFNRWLLTWYSNNQVDKTTLPVSAELLPVFPEI